jgi:hypothetical protein
MYSVAHTPTQSRAGSLGPPESKWEPNVKCEDEGSASLMWGGPRNGSRADGVQPSAQQPIKTSSEVLGARNNGLTHPPRESRQAERKRAGRPGDLPQRWQLLTKSQADGDGATARHDSGGGGRLMSERRRGRGREKETVTTVGHRRVCGLYQSAEATAADCCPLLPTAAATTDSECVGQQSEREFLAASLLHESAARSPIRPGLGS